MSPKLLARLQLVAAGVLFSTGGAAIKATTLSGWQVAGYRSGIAALTVLLLASAARRRWTWRTTLVGICYALTLLLFVLANKLTTSANSIFLQATAPLYLLLLAPWLLREPIRRRELLFMAAVAGGMLLFFVGIDPPVATAPDPFRGNILAAFSGLTWAGTILGLRWMGRSEGATGASGTVVAVVAGNVFASLIAFSQTWPPALPSGPDLAIVSYLGVFQIGVAYLLVTAGVRHVTALEVSILLLVEPVLNPVWTWLLHGEEPSAWALVGGAVILGATTIKTGWDARTARSARLGGAPVDEPSG